MFCRNCGNYYEGDVEICNQCNLPFDKGYYCDVCGSHCGKYNHCSRCLGYVKGGIYCNLCGTINNRKSLETLDHGFIETYVCTNCEANLFENMKPISEKPPNTSKWKNSDSSFISASSKIEFHDNFGLSIFGLFIFLPTGLIATYLSAMARAENENGNPRTANELSHSAKMVFFAGLFIAIIIVIYAVNMMQISIIN